MRLLALLGVPMTVHEPDPHPQLMVVGLVDPAAGPAWGHPHDLVELGTPLVDPVRS